ncbi:MAG: DUF4012 domain-containing protein [Candidatus Moranbacteria bacterium]|nr:DUF4012 domain-containing protein [Candidatus Moranbacteria bacterium]
MAAFFTRGRIIALSLLALVTISGFFLFFYAKEHKEEFAAGGLSLFEKVSRLLPLEPDTKKEIETVNTLVSHFTENDGKTYTLLLLLQNNYELRPGGGFLGQYGILKVQNGKILSFTFEDANLLDQRITAKVTPPWPLTRYAQIKKWKFRDSNFSPDFPTNAAKAEYFYRLSGGRTQFDGVIAVNADVLNHVIGVVGSITVPGFGTYTAENAAIDLEEDVERAYLGDDVPAELKQNRKNVMKILSAEIVKRIGSIGDIQKLANLGLEELRNKNIQLFFKDATLQEKVASVHWDGAVSKEWSKDYLMIVDANLGALKTDYYMRRSLEYTVDFTGEKPKATVLHTYDHTATRGDWRTSDYHTYTRILAPSGSKYIDQSRIKTGGVSSQESTEWSKTVFGYKVDALIGTTLPTGISYELPSTITPENYELLIQKQSGTGTIPVKVTLRTREKEYVETFELKKDLRVSIKTTEEQKN